MSSKSIVDRVLLFAAAICAAGLVWQLTVLMTSKQRASSTHKIETIATAPAQAVDGSAPTAAVAPVRVVYADSTSPKRVGKAMDMVSDTSSDAAPTRSISPAPGFAVQPPPDSPEPKAAASTLATDQPASQMASANAAEPIGLGSPADQAAATAPAKVADLAPATLEGKTPSNQTININHASVEDLNHIEGAGRIGQAIASHRPYASVEDLLKKRVVRRNVYDHIKSRLAAE